MANVNFDRFAVFPVLLLFSFLFDAFKVNGIAWSNGHGEEVVEDDVVEKAKSNRAPRQAQVRAQPLLEHWRDDQEEGVGVEADEDVEAKAKTEAEHLHHDGKRVRCRAEQLIYQCHF